MKVKTLVSEKYHLLPLEQQKLLKSFGWSLLALLALFLAEFLNTGALNAKLGDLAVFVPFVVNFLNKWGKENSYQVK